MFWLRMNYIWYVRWDFHLTEIKQLITTDYIRSKEENPTVFHETAHYRDLQNYEIMPRFLQLKNFILKIIVTFIKLLPM